MFLACTQKSPLSLPLLLQTDGTAARPFKVTFTNLDPGTWTFEVTAVNKNGRTAAALTAAIVVKSEFSVERNVSLLLSRVHHQHTIAVALSAEPACS